MKLSRRGPRVAFFVLSALVFLGSLYVVYRGITGFRESRILDDVLSRVDARIDSGRYEEVPELLDQASRVISTPRNALRLLKRSYRLADLTGDYRDLRNRSERWHRRYPEDSRISALALLSIIAGGEDERASEEEAAGFLRPGERFFEDFPHLGAAYLQLLGKRGELSGYPYDLLLLDRTSTPGAFFSAAEVTGLSQLAANGVLQLASGGFLRDARLQGEALNLETEAPLLMATLAYDLGDWSKAAELLAPIPAADPGSLLLRGDVMYLSGRWETALRAYEGLFLEGRPEGPLSYNNAALIPREAQDRVALLESGLARYPGDAMLLAALSDYLGPPGIDAHLPRLEERLASESGVAGEGASVARDRLVYYLLTQADRRPPEANVSQLWSIANDHPESVVAIRYLAWYLAGLGRPEELGRLPTGTEADPSRSLAFYRALHHNSAGRKEEAFLDFRSAHRSRYAWQAAYNAAALALELERYPDAREILQEAQNEAWYLLSDSQRGRLKLLEARLHLREGNMAGAQAAVREALALSPESTAAIRLYDALEGQ